MICELEPARDASRQQELTDADSYAYLAKFIHDRIRQAVGDLEFAELLCPVLEKGYYQAFSQPHVNQRGSEDLVAEGAALANDGQVRFQDQLDVFVVAAEDLEEQVCGVLFEGPMANLVDDDQPKATQLGQFGGSR